MKRQRKEKDDSGFLPLSSPEGRPLVVSSLLFSVPSYGSLSFLGTFLLVSPLLSFLQETQWAERVFIWRRRGMLCLVLSSCTFPLPLGLYDRKGAGRQETRHNPPPEKDKRQHLKEDLEKMLAVLSFQRRWEMKERKTANDIFSRSLSIFSLNAFRLVRRRIPGGCLSYPQPKAASGYILPTYQSLVSAFRRPGGRMERSWPGSLGGVNVFYGTSSPNHSCIKRPREWL